MRHLLAILCFASACSLVLSASGRTVKKAYADSTGWVHIITADDRDHVAKPEEWQDGGAFESVDVAKDGRTVGWLADQLLKPPVSGTNYDYPVALVLYIWRDGRVIRRIPASAFSIQDWVFLKDGSQVAMHVEPPHGQRSYDCALYDVNTGKELASWSLDRRDYAVPNWAKPLLANEQMPDSDDLAMRFPNAPKPRETTTARH